MQRRSALVTLSAPFVATGSEITKLTLSAEPGNFSAETLRRAAARAFFNVSMRIVAYAGTDRWPTAAYVGGWPVRRRRRNG